MQLKNILRSFDGNQCQGHDCQGDGQADEGSAGFPHITQDAGDEVAHTTDCCRSKGIGELGGYVVHMGTLGSGTGHDGGV